MLTYILPTRRAATAAMAACAAVALAAFTWGPIERLEARGVADTAARAERIEMGYTLRFDGVGAEGIDNVWTGRLRGDAHGEVTLRLWHVGPDVDRAKAKWPVKAIVFVAADDPRQSFAADMEGTIDWKSGAMRLSGGITEGRMKGAAVWQNAQLDPKQFDGAGTLTIGLLTAKRS
jgi:hypothetical protein